MKPVDPGHSYEVDGYDGGTPQVVHFMKRMGPGYPFNDSAYGGTNCQEILRVLIDRVKYLDRQQACAENAEILYHLRKSLLLFEERAASRHGKLLPAMELQTIDSVPHCAVCGHLYCGVHAKTEEVHEHTAIDRV